MSEIAKLYVTVGANTGDAEQGMDRLSGKVGGFAKLAGGVLVAGVAAGGAAIAGLGIASVKMAADFENAMREVNTMMGLTQGEFKAMSSEVNALASTMGIDAVEAAKGLYNAISAGIPKENAVDFMAIAAKVAIGGATDIATAVDGMTTSVNAFQAQGVTAQQAADVLFATMARGKTTVAELSRNMAVAAPTAAALGVTYEELMAATATLTKGGDLTSVAMNKTRAAMLSLANPTKELTAVWKESGYESGQAALKALGYQGALKLLYDSVEGDVGRLKQLVGSDEALGGILGITGAMEGVYQEDLGEIQNAMGKTNAAFEEMNRGFSRQMAILKSGIKGGLIEIGSELLPVLTPVVSLLAKNLPVGVRAGVQGFKDFLSVGRSVVTLFRTMDLDEATGAFGVLTDKVGGLARPILRATQLFRILRDWMGPLVTGLRTGQSSFALMGLQMALMADEFHGVGVWVGRAVTGFRTVKGVVDDLMTGLIVFREAIKSVFAGDWQRALNVLGFGFEHAGAGAMIAVAAIGGLVGLQVLNWATDAVAGIGNVGRSAGDAGRAVSDLWRNLSRGPRRIVTTVTTVYETVGKAVSSASSFVQTVTQNIVRVGKDVLEAGEIVTQVVRQEVVRVGSGVIDAGSLGVDALRGALVGAGGAIGAAMGGAILSGIGTSLVAGAATAMAPVGAVIASAMAWFGLAAAGVMWGQWLSETFEKTPEKVGEFLGNLLANIINGGVMLVGGGIMLAQNVVKGLGEIGNLFMTEVAPRVGEAVRAFMSGDWLRAFQIGLDLAFDLFIKWPSVMIPQLFLKFRGIALPEIDLSMGDILGRFGTWLGEIRDEWVRRATAILTGFKEALFEKLSPEARTALSGLRDAFVEWFGKIASTIAPVVSAMENLWGLVSRVGGAISRGDFGAIPGAVTGQVEARAMGGPVASGMGYLVGEQGPELFVPRSSGTIVPNHAMGGGTVILNMTINGAQSPQAVTDEVIRRALPLIQRQLGNGGMTLRHA